MLTVSHPSPLASWCQFYCLVNRDTRAIVACPELLVRKLVELGIEPATLRSTGRNHNHTTLTIGPAAYAMNASDLRTVNPKNSLSKFADDTGLIVGSGGVTSSGIEKYQRLGSEKQSMSKSNQICRDGVHKSQTEKQE